MVCPPGRREGAAPSWCGLLLGPLWGLGALNSVSWLPKQEVIGRAVAANEKAFLQIYDTKHIIIAYYAQR